MRSVPPLKGVIAKGANLKGCTIYVARVGARDDIRISRPCSRCMKMIHDAGIKRIVYTNLLGTISAERVSGHAL